jgi:hypothetical protein
VLSASVSLVLMYFGSDGGAESLDHEQMPVEEAEVLMVEVTTLLTCGFPSIPRTPA